MNLLVDNFKSHIFSIWADEVVINEIIIFYWFSNFIQQLENLGVQWVKLKLGVQNEAVEFQLKGDFCGQIPLLYCPKCHSITTPKHPTVLFAFDVSGLPV